MSHIASPGVNTRGHALALLLALEVGDDQTATWFEHARDFPEPLTFETIRQVVHHQGREDNIERLIGKVETLNHSQLELDWRAEVARFRAGASDLLRTGINAGDVSSRAHAPLDFERQRTRATAHIQRMLSWLKAGQVNSPSPKLAYLTTEHQGIEEPCHQVIAPPLVEN